MWRRTRPAHGAAGCVRIRRPGGSAPNTEHQREDSNLRGGSDSARGSAWEQAPGEPASGGDCQRRGSPPDASSPGGRSRSSLRSIAESEPLPRRRRPAIGAAKRGSNRLPWWVAVTNGARARGFEPPSGTARGATRCGAEAGPATGTARRVRIECPGGSAPNTEHQREDSNLHPLRLCPRSRPNTKSVFFTSGLTTAESELLQMVLFRDPHRILPQVTMKGSACPAGSPLDERRLHHPHDLR